MNEAERLESQMRFLVDIDRLKKVMRRTLLMDSSRFENDAEHSWHLAMMAIVLAEYADPPVSDLSKVLRMVVIHDLVEIDAGDTFCYDDAGNRDKREREEAAAQRVFSMLPIDQGTELRALWEEFESRRTPEARFAAALDRLHPILHNYHTRGAAWIQNGVTRAKVIERNRHIEAGAPRLWTYVQGLISDAVARGYLPDR